MTRRRERTRGFTLIEVLVAVAIFAFIGIGANALLRTIIDTHEKTLSLNDRYAMYSRLFDLVERDLMQVTPRPVRGEYGDTLPALEVGGTPYLLEFTHDGWSNPANRPRSDLQRVAYALDEDGNVVRRFWLVVDRAEDSEPVTQTLLSHVDDFRVNAVLDDGSVVDQWPPGNPTDLPFAVEILIDIDGVGELRKVVPIVAPAQVAAPASAPGSGTSP